MNAVLIKSRVRTVVTKALTWGDKKGRVLGIVGIYLLLAGCASSATRTTPSALNPRGPAAANIAELWWIMFGLGTAVFVAVTAILLYTVYTRRVRQPDVAANVQAPEDRRWIWWGGVIIPAVILVITLFFTLRSLAVLASPPTPAAITIDVIGHRWWWEVRYPAQDFTTANEMHVPVGQPVQLRLTSNDVIHSFWVPQLHGKMDLIPGRTNLFWIQADTPGTYRGLCAEYCGIQHAKMQFMVVAETPEDFEAWVARESQPALPPADEAIRRGQQVFLGSSCVYCHTVRGTNATGTVGPDLTHLASRQTVAAGVLTNNRGNMGAWITDPQHIKPGNLMPSTNLSAEELQAMLLYLESLQ